VDAKYTLCWDVSNELMRVTLIALILQVVLLVFLSYILHGWYRLLIVQTPPDAFYKDGVPKSVVDEALEILKSPSRENDEEQLVLLSDKSFGDDDDHLYKRPRPVSASQRIRAAKIVELSRNACHKYLSTTIWAIIMLSFLVAGFALFFVWQEKYDEITATNC